MMVYIYLIVGFILLIKGADSFVNGSSSIALILKVPVLIVGLTIVAMGTSAPEAAISVSAAIKGENAIAISNVIGSNFFNLFVVIGFCALIKPINISPAIIKRDYPLNLIFTLVLISLCFLGDMTLGHIDGIIMLILFISFIIVMIRIASKHQNGFVEIEVGEVTEIKKKKLTPFLCVYFIIVGIAGIALGGNMVVDSASQIALSFGLSQHLIGLTIVAVGTSLPELVTSLVASIKGENELALGNVVGSNIFNLLLILGLSSSIKTIPIDVVSMYDLSILLLGSLVIFAYFALNKKVGKIGGILMLLFYSAYMYYIITR